MLIEKSHQAARENFDKIAPQLTGWAVYRTHRSTGQSQPPPSLVAQGGKGGAFKVHNEAHWGEYQGRPKQQGHPPIGQTHWHQHGMPKQYGESEDV